MKKCAGFYIFCFPPPSTQTSLLFWLLFYMTEHRFFLYLKSDISTTFCCANLNVIFPRAPVLRVILLNLMLALAKIFREQKPDYMGEVK